MLIADVESFLAQGLQLMGLSIANQAEAISRLAIYFQELKKWNAQVNLVARSQNDRQILESHFLDSLTLLALLTPENRARETLLDVGTGGGFPGLVLKAACPVLAVTLVEPRTKRFYFLKHMVRTLQLQEVEILDVTLRQNTKAGELAKKRFSLITSRAFTDSQHFIELVAPYLEKSGRIVLMQGPVAGGVINDLGRTGMEEQFYLADTRKLYLPFSKKERWLFSIKRWER